MIMSKIKSLLIVTDSGGSTEYSKYCFYPGCNIGIGYILYSPCLQHRNWVFINGSMYLFRGHWGGRLGAGTGFFALGFVPSNIYNFFSIIPDTKG